MQINPRTDRLLHSKLPIDNDEKILAIIKHHWFAYASSWAVGIGVAVLVMVVATALVMFGGGDVNSGSPLVQYKSQILAGAAVFSIVILAASAIPVYLRSQEQLVLTEEAILQVLQPSLFASKIDQLGLQHIADVSVTQDLFGTLFGYGHINIETPGEQDNYEFFIVPKPHEAARAIIQAHENYNAALQGGMMPTTLGKQVVKVPTIDPQEYQQFLAYQQMVNQQQSQQAAQTNDPTNQDDQSSQNSGK